MGTTLMAKKKAGPKADLKLGAVKIEVDIITRAKMIAADQGKPLATYLSDSLRTVVERDWAKMIRKAGSEGGAE